MTANPEQLPRALIANAMRLLDAPDCIQKLDPDHFLVVGLRNRERRLRVYKSGQNWRCQSDRRSNQDKPCAHILAVLDYEGLLELPATFARRSQAAREMDLEERARSLIPTRLPELLAQLLTANPGQEAPYNFKGRPPRPVFPQAFQAIARSVFRHSIRSSHAAAEDRLHNPWGSVSRTTLTRFLASRDRAAYVARLAHATLAPARAHEPLPGAPRLVRVTTPNGHVLAEVTVSSRYGLLSSLRIIDPGGPAPQPTEQDRLPGLAGLVGWQLASTAPVAQNTEANCLLVAHNLSRLILLELEQGFRVQFHRLPLDGAAPADAPAAPARA